MTEPLTEDELARPLTAEATGLAIRKAITDAYYEARNAGRTMEDAADEATAAVVATLDAAPVADTAGIDVDGLCGECGHDANEHVHYCSHDDRSSCDCNAEYTRLAAALHTPKPEGDR